MSYILDALRKADAERERGTVPGIHAQPMFAGTSMAGAPRTARPWVWVVVAVMMLVLVAALLWTLLGGPAPRDAAGPALPPPVATMPAPAPAPVTVAPVPAARTPEAITPRPEPTQAPRKPKPAVPAAPKIVATQPATKAPAASASPTAPAKAGAPASSAATDSNRVYALNELPDDIRRQLPAITVGGSMYSATPANRLLIINGQVLHEGDPVAPELMLQQIKLKAAVLAYKGYRYEITY